MLKWPHLYEYIWISYSYIIYTSYCKEIWYSTCFFVTPVSNSINISNHQRHGITMARELNAGIYWAIPRHLSFGGDDLEVSGNRSLNEWQWLTSLVVLGRYVSTIVLAIFWGYFALHRPETAYVYGIRTSNLGSEMSIDLSDPIKIKLFNQCGTRGPGSH